MAALVDIEKDYRARIGSEVARAFGEQDRANRARGLFPYEGRWRGREEIAELQKSMKRQDRELARELVGLLALLFLAAAALSFLAYLLVR